jgi:anti-anti-sigma factor
LTAKESRGVVVVTVEETRIDRTNFVQFFDGVSEHLRPNVKLALGLGHVRSVDGRGWGALLVLHKQIAALSGEVVLFELQQPVRRRLLQLDLHKIMSISNGGDQALAAFAETD